MLDLTSPSTIRTLIDQHNLWPAKRLGQNFLVNREDLETIIATAEISSNDCVIEIGTGLGTLTKELALRTNKLISIELDQKLKPLHKSILPGINILYQNALDFEPPDIPYKIIANIPYYITSPLLSHFLKNEYINGKKRIPKLIVLMIQKEVAEKLCARDKLNVLALNTQPFANVEIVKVVEKSKFYPPPKVDSAIIKLIPYASPLITASLKTFYTIVHSAFSQKRKKLINALPSKLHFSQTQVKMIVEKAGIDGNRRPETLSIEEWSKIAQCIEDEGVRELGDYAVRTLGR